MILTVKPISPNGVMKSDPAPSNNNGSFKHGLSYTSTEFIKRLYIRNTLKTLYRLDDKLISYTNSSSL